MADLFGMHVGDLPPGWQPIRALAVIECVVLDDADDTGTMRKLALRAPEGTLTWDMLGMLQAMLLDVEQQYLAQMVADDE